MRLTAQPWEYSPRIQLSSRATGFPQTSGGNLCDGRADGRFAHRHSANKWWWSPGPSGGRTGFKPPHCLLGCVTVGKSFHPRGPVTPPIKRGYECPPQRAVGRSKRNNVPNALTERASVVARSSHEFPAVPLRRVRTRDQGSPVSVSRSPTPGRRD